MNEQNILKHLRNTYKSEVASAPRQHRLKTPECPPLSRFASALSSGWNSEEQAHVDDCPYCQLSTALAWRSECPGILQLLGHLVDPARNRQAWEKHLVEDDCLRCQQLLARPWVQALATGLRAGTQTMEAVKAALKGRLWDWFPLSSGVAVPGGAFDEASHPEAFRHFTQRGDADFTVSLDENDAGHFVLAVQTPRTDLANARVHVTLTGEKGTWETDICMGVALRGASYGEVDLGPGHAVLQPLGTHVVLDAMLIDRVD